MPKPEYADVVYSPKWDGAFFNWTLDYECDADWHTLTLKDQERVRHCVACRREVHFCTEQSQLDELAGQGHCVAFYEARPKATKPTGMRLGLPKYLILDGAAVSYFLRNALGD